MNQPRKYIVRQMCRDVALECRRTRAWGLRGRLPGKPGTPMSAALWAAQEWLLYGEYNEQWIRALSYPDGERFFRDRDEVRASLTPEIKKKASLIANDVMGTVLVCMRAARNGVFQIPAECIEAGETIITRSMHDPHTVTAVSAPDHAGNVLITVENGDQHQIPDGQFVTVVTVVEQDQDLS